MAENSKYQVFFQVNDEIEAGPRAQVHDKLAPGQYQVKYDPRFNLVSFQTMKAAHDGLIDLPGTQYDDVMRDVDLFLTPECRARYAELDYLYKLNIFLHGRPGTGKTCIVNRVTQKVIDRNGIVLFNPDPRSLAETFKIFDAIQPETRILVIFEEFDQLVARYEEILLHVLDGEVQKENVMYIATTNYVDKVPARILRPGRFPTVLEVVEPSYEARLFYLNLKLKGKEELCKRIANATNGFTIDELKAVVQSTYCLQKDLGKTIARLKKSKGMPVDTAESCDNDCDGCSQCCDLSDACEPCDDEAPTGVLRAMKVNAG